MKVRMVKVTRRKNPENKSPAQISTGKGFVGDLQVPTAELLDYWERTRAGEDIDPDVLDGKLYEVSEDGTPIIGAPVLIGRLPWGLMTSRIRSFYKEGSDNDKLVVPSDFPREELEKLDMTNLEEGDMLFLTMNSVYWAREYTEEKEG